MEQRNLVEFLAGCVIPERDMVKVIINPKSKRPISPVTLRQHFRAELDRGLMGLRARHHAALFKNVEGGNVTAQIWWDKTRNGVREQVELEAPAPAAEIPGDESISEAARRVAFTLAMGATLLTRKAEKPSGKKKQTA